MKTGALDLLHGNLWKNIALFSVPLIFSRLLQVLFNMSDIAVVGHYAGPEALGAVGSTAILVTLFTALPIGIGDGINAIVARFYGAGKEKDVSRSVHTSFIVSLITGFLLCGLCLFFADDLLALLHTKEELTAGALLYLRLYSLGFPASALYNFGNGVLSAIGDTKKPLLFLLIAGIVNVILNLFFVIVCHWDVAGVAVASVVSQYLSAFLTVGALMKARDCYAFRFSSLAVDRQKLGMVLALGIPSGCQNAIFSIANLFIQAAVNSFDALIVEGNSAAANADGIVYNVMAAVYVACTSFIAQNYGAGNKERVIKSYRISLLYSFAAGGLIGLFLLFFGPGFLSLFTASDAVIDAGMKRLSIMGLSYGFSALMDNSIAASRGLGKTVVPTVVVIMGSCVFRVLWVYTVFAYFHTIPSLYLLYIFSWAITGVAELVYFLRIRNRLLKELDPVRT